LPRLSTLNTLSRFIGYADWNAYLLALEQRDASESDMFQGEGLTLSSFQPGDLLEVSWQPNRRCVFRYLGDNQFIVLESKNAKLHIGDRFSTAAFIIGRPMYLDNVLLADGTRTSYVAGKRNGLSAVTKISPSQQ
jgi:hypothetical protein